MKVCDRVFATEDEEESTSEHSYRPGKGNKFVLLPFVTFVERVHTESDVWQ